MFKKASLLSNIPEEPSADPTNAVQFLFRMPNGSNIERRFKDDTVIEVDSFPKA
jgi:hypothetical protein